MYTTKEAIKIIEDNKLGLVLYLQSDPTVKLFKNTSNEILISGYKDREITILKDCEKDYSKVAWALGFKDSRFIK
jgi:hypothetical protein